MKEDEKFREFVYVNYKLEDFNLLLDEVISVYDKVFTNQPICHFLLKSNFICLIYTIFFIRVMMS